MKKKWQGVVDNPLMLAIVIIIVIILIFGLLVLK